MNNFSDFSFNTDFANASDFTQAPAHPDKCTQCSICVLGCPTYQVTKDFDQSPMGRIKILRQKTEDITNAQKDALESCLHCFRCESLCPSSVDYRELIVDAFARLELPQKEKKTIKLLKEHITSKSSNNRFSKIVGPLAKAIKPFAPWLSPITSSMLHHLTTAQSIHTPKVEHVDTVLFSGCLGETVQSDVINDASYLLQSLGLNPRIEREACCGALHRHSGDKPASLEMASENIIELSDTSIKHITHISSACNDSMRHYDHWLDSQTLPLDDILSVKHKSIDIIDLLHQYDWRPTHSNSRFKKVLVHFPCSMTQDTKDHLTALLNKLEGINITYAASEPGCCGAGGTHAVSHPQLSQDLLQPLLDQIDDVDADLVISGNIGCRLHIHSGVLAGSRAVDVMHPVCFFRQFT